MNDLEFCKQQISAIAENTTADLSAKVIEFLKKRMPIEPAHRAGLKAWAARELARLETLPGGGVSRLVPHNQLAEVSRRMTVLQTVISQIEAAE